MASYRLGTPQSDTKVQFQLLNSSKRQNNRTIRIRNAGIVVEIK
jgi:hypothetical protein